MSKSFHAGRSRIWLLASCAGLALSGVAAAQVTFTNITQSAGITFTLDYGKTLDLDTDIPESAVPGLEIVQRNQGNGVAVADYDNDGDLDLLFLGQLRHPSVLYRNDLGAGFVDVTEQSGVRNLGVGRVAQFVDLNNDGWKDLIIANDRRCDTVDHASVLYRNNGDGTFTDVTESSGFTPTGLIIGGMGLTDYQRDGLVDIYVTFWGALQQGKYTYFEGHNRLYKNLGNFQFQDVTRAVGLEKVSSNCYTPIFCDFDKDGDADLYIAVDGYSDKYYRNDNGSFVDKTLVAGATHVGTDMGIAPCDFDNDGDIDLYCTNATHPQGLYGGNTLLVNQLVPSGSMFFQDQAAARGVWDTAWGWGTEWVDVDNDGDRDLFAVNGFDEYATYYYDAATAAGYVNQPANLFLNDGTGHFTEPLNTGAEVIGDARATIAFDVDRDGDLDLLISHINAAPVLLRNDTPSANHWLDIELIGGAGSSRDAIGAKIQVVAGGTTYTHEVIGGGSFQAGRPFEAHFGLGAATIVSDVWVTWPNGTTTHLVNVPVDQHLFVS